VVVSEFHNNNTIIRVQDTHFTKYQIKLISLSSERSFSSFRHPKTFTRNNIDQKRLSNMAISHIEKTFKINFNTIIDQFDADLTERGRRLQL
jgi:hypothetical protein